MVALKQLVTSEFCLECKGCCRFSSTLWLPCLLREETAATGIRNVTARGQEGNLRCEFLNVNDYRCAVYAQRPFECRLYPFLIVRGEDATLDLAAHLACPFILAMIESVQCREYIRDLLALFEDPGMQTSLRNGREAFRCYPSIELVMVKHNLLNDKP